MLLGKCNIFVFASLVSLVMSCGPEQAISYEVAGTYTERGAWHRGRFVGGTPATTILREDGSAARYGGGCPDPGWGDDELSWNREGDTVVVYRNGAGEVVSRLRLASEQCGDHAYTADGTEYSQPYVAGRYCPVDVSDLGHVGLRCDWEPCSDVAKQCAEIFDAEAEE
jgi:hypothetical protein